MHAFTEAGLEISESKTARMEQRTKPHVKQTIQEAAALLGVEESVLVSTAAYERARAIIADHHRLALTAADAEAVFAAIDNPTPKTSAELADEDLHGRLVVSG